MEMVRDPLWQFVGALLGLITILITIWIFLKERARKAITYQVVSFSPLLTLKEEESGDFQILYKGQEVQDIFLVSLRVINTGNVPIVPNEYEHPLSFVFGARAQVFSAEIVNTEPRNLPIDLSIEDNKVTLAPVLLNSGDLIEIKCLVGSPDRKKIWAEGRIVGVKEIDEKRVNPARYLGWGFIGLLLMAGATIGMMINKAESLELEQLQSEWPYLLLTFIGVVIALAGILLHIRHRGFRRFLGFVWYSLSSVFTRD